MGRKRKLKKSGGGELEVNKQDVIESDEAIPLSVVVLDEAILMPYVVGGDEGVVESHVTALDATIVEQNIVALDVAITQKNVVALDATITDALLGPGVNPLEGSPNVKLRKLGSKGTLPASNSKRG
jgi:hypothetical protein